MTDTKDQEVTSDDVVELAQKYGIPPALALAFFQQESSGGKNIGKSSKGAVGPLQVTKPTFDAMDVGTDINDPYQATEAGIKYLAQAYAKNPNPMAVAAYYHAGPAWKKKLSENPNLGDGGIRTVDYAKQIAQKYKSIQQTMSGSGLQNVSDTQPTSADERPIYDYPPGTSELGTAKYPYPGGTITVNAQRSKPAETADEAEAADSPTEETAEAATTPTVYQGGTIEINADAPQTTTSLDSQIEDLMTSASEVANDVVSTSQQLREKLKANLSAQRDNFAKGGELAATVAMERFQQEQRKAGEHAAVLSKLGINTSDTDGLFASVVEEMQSDRERLLALNDQITRKKSSSLLPDPVGFFMDRMTVGDDVKEYNRLARNYNINEEFINNATDEAARITSVNAGKFAPTSLKGAQAAADLQKTAYAEKAFEIDDKLSRIDLDTQVRTLQALTTRINTLTAQQKAIDLKQVREDQSAEKQRKLEQAKLDDQRVTIAGRILGIDISGVSELKRQRPDIRNAVSRIIANGGEEDGKIAASPLEAEEILRVGNPTKMPFATQYMSKLLTSVRRRAEQEVQTAVSQGQLQDKSKAGMVAAINSKMFTDLNDIIQNPHKSVQYDGLSGMTNPFEAPRLEVMEKDPNAQNLQITKLLQNFKKTAPTVVLTDNLITQIAYQNVGKTYKNISEAAKDVASYFKAVTVRNNQIFKFSNIGLPDQTLYMGDSTVNLADYKSVLKQFLKIEAFRHGDNGRLDLNSLGAKVGNKLMNYFSEDQ